MALDVKRPVGVVRICVDLALSADLDRAQETLRDVSKTSDGRQSSAKVEARAEVERLEAAMRAATVEIRVKALPRVDFQRIVAAHPPNRAEPADKHFGMNCETVVPELVAACFDSACWVESGEPAQLTAEEVPAFVDQLTDGQAVALLLECVGVNRGNHLAPTPGARISPPSQT
jgi:hypothetical protein